MKIASKVVKSQASRARDPFGSGQYGASRGHRKHNGLDIITKTGEVIYSPINGTVVRESLPYGDDLRYRGVLIRGKDEWAGYEIKIFYVEGISIGEVKAGDAIGRAQDLNIKYPGITNHVHIEVKKHGNHINPFDIWQMCF